MASHQDKKVLDVHVEQNRVVLQGTLSGTERSRSLIEDAFLNAREFAGNRNYIIVAFVGRVQRCSLSGISLWVELVHKHLQDLEIHYESELFEQELKDVGDLYSHPRSFFRPESTPDNVKQLSLVRSAAAPFGVKTGW